MNKPCPRCLLAELNEEDLLRTLRETIRAMDPDEKVSEGVYEARLAACRACPHLIRAMCGKCGCYVELRCAQRAMRCPDVPARWDRVPLEE